MRAEIRLNLKSKEDAETVRSSVEPDNVPLPDGLMVKSQRKGKQLILWIRCHRNIESFMATIEDLMGAVDLSVRMIQTLAGNEQ